MNEQILKGLYTFPDEFWSEISASAKDLIRQMMCVDPNTRLTMAGVLEHPWLARDFENTTRVEKMMCPTLQPMRSMKRPAPRDDSIEMDQDNSTATTNAGAFVSNKRPKY